MKLKITPLLWTFLIAIGFVASFSVGFAISRDQTIKTFSIEIYRMNVLNEIYFYSEFMKILRDNESGNTTSAICHGQKATALLSQKIKECLSDGDCKKHVYTNVSLLAPELLINVEASVGVSKNGGKVCS